MNFDQDFIEFSEHIKTPCSIAGKVNLTNEEGTAIRLFVAYLNCKYSQFAPPSNHLSCACPFKDKFVDGKYLVCPNCSSRVLIKGG